MIDKKHLIIDSNLSEDQVMHIQSIVQDPIGFTETLGTIKGRSFSFAGREHLHAIYYDEHPRVVIVASRQVEKSETVARKMIHTGFVRPYTTITYTAPRSEQVSRFQAERFRGAIRESKEGVLENSIDATRDAKTAVRLTNRTIFYFGSGWSDGDALRGIPADLVFFDEVQDLTQTAIESIEKSVSHSELQDNDTELNGRCLYTGTPKQTGTYYQRVLWNMSDQKKWFVRCRACDTEQSITMKNIVDDPVRENRKYFACLECFDELDRQNGTWLPTKPENKLYSGYHLTQLNMSWISANQIWRDYNTMDEMTFANEVLGEFFTGQGKPVTYEDVLGCTNHRRDMASHAHHPTVLGIDYGSGTKSKTIITIGHNGSDDKLVIDFIENTKLVHEELIEHIAQLVRKYSVERIVGDIGYGSYEHSQLRKMFGTMATACRYVSYSDNPSKRIIKDDGVLHVDRTHSMDKLIDMFKKRRIDIPYKTPGKVEEFFDHYTAIETIFSESQQARKLYDHKVPDDAFHSLNYVREGIEDLNKRFEWDGVERDTEMDDLLHTAIDEEEIW